MEKKLFFKIHSNLYNIIFEYLNNKKIKYLLSFHSKVLQNRLNLNINDFKKEMIRNYWKKIKNVFNYNSFYKIISKKNKYIDENTIKDFLMKKYEHLLINIDDLDLENIKRVNSKIIYNFVIKNFQCLNITFLDKILI